MSSSVTITSSRPNNALVGVIVQTIDDHAGAVGQGEIAALLDDGESFVAHLELNQVVTLIERPRGNTLEGLRAEFADATEAEPQEAAVEQPAEPAPEPADVDPAPPEAE